MPITFTKVSLPFGWLGNMAAFPIQYGGHRWRTSEALFQALRFEDDLIREEIRKQTSPMSAKMIAKQLEYRDRMVIEPMSHADLENMRMCLRLKFNQHALLKRNLLNTGTELIIEDIGRRNGLRHLFWGAKLVNGEWVGQNHMGQLLMAVREEMKETTN